MEFFTDIVGQALGTFSPGDMADTFRDAHGALAGQVVHGIAGGPDIIQNAAGHATGYVYHGFGGQASLTDALGRPELTFDAGVAGGPDLFHDAAGSLIGAIQRGAAAGLPSTLMDANWSGMAQSFNVQGLQGF